MKTLNIVLEDKEYERALAVKERWGVSWRGFIVQAAKAHRKR